MGDAEVHTTAELRDGRRVEGEAWWHADEHARRITWGSEDLPDYGGELDLRGHADGTTVTLRLRTPWDADDEVQQAVEASVAAIADALGGEPSSV